MATSNSLLDNFDSIPLASLAEGNGFRYGVVEGEGQCLSSGIFYPFPYVVSETISHLHTPLPFALKMSDEQRVYSVCGVDSNLYAARL